MIVSLDEYRESPERKMSSIRGEWESGFRVDHVSVETTLDFFELEHTGEGAEKLYRVGRSEINDAVDFMENVDLWRPGNTGRVLESLINHKKTSATTAMYALEALLKYKNRPGCFVYNIDWLFESEARPLAAWLVDNTESVHSIQYEVSHGDRYDRYADVYREIVYKCAAVNIDPLLVFDRDFLPSEAGCWDAEKIRKHRDAALSAVFALLECEFPIAFAFSIGRVCGKLGTSLDTEQVREGLKTAREMELPVELSAGLIFGDLVEHMKEYDLKKIEKTLQGRKGITYM